MLLGIINNNGSINALFWSIDPSVNRLLEYSTAEGLTTVHNSKYALTDKGAGILEKIKSEEELKNELHFFESLGKGITEALVTTHIKSWG